MFRKTTFKLAALLALVGTTALVPSSAGAQTTAQYYGTIRSVFVSSGHNEAFRITLTNNGASALTGCAGDFAYVNIDWDNYQTDVAELTTLYIRGTPITVTAVHDSNGFCQLIEFGT